MSNCVVVFTMETVMEIASTESSSPIPGVHMCFYTWWPLTTLSFEKYDHSPAVDKTLITAQRNKFSLFNAGSKTSGRK